MTAVVPVLAALLAAQPAPAPKAATLDTAVLAGGCFWGTEGIFEHVKGVVQVISGYAGGTLPNPTSAQVYKGGTGHAESVMIIFDPARVSFDQLLLIFFNVAHNPTELNRQGPDIGSDYRSIAFYRDATQKQSIDDALAGLKTRRIYSDPIVTEVLALRAFYPAEAEHQGFMQRHLTDPYITINDLPKLDILRTRYSGLYRAEWHD
ncbi:MAG TPA: peptide-methionine (S)-S-oxide reductase MsrA [Gemmatimonadales bacterium]|jgi:peptide-methionine (S)-S-oxide reductase|nr:peptide-methionine (S)-S-oxide reductase MsrA [Gemmatimonadales bacterium]